MPVILLKNGIPVKHVGDVQLKDIPRRELYVFSTCAAWTLRKNHVQFNKEFRRGVYNGVGVRRHTRGWMFNYHDVIKFMFPYVNEEKIADIMNQKLDEYTKENPLFKKMYLE